MFIGINDRDYKLPERWADITLSKSLELSRLIADMPKSLKELYTKEVMLPEEDIIKTAPIFYGKVIALLGGVEVEVIERCYWHERTAIYKQFLEMFILESMYQPQDVSYIEHFDFKGECYYLPISQPSLKGERLGAVLSTIEFTESADLEIYSRQLKGGKMEVMANIISILCRPKGEPYNEQICLARAKEFEQLPMDIVWSVFFSFATYISNYAIHFQTSQEEEGLRAQEPNLTPV